MLYRFVFTALLSLAFVLSVSLSAAQAAGMAMPMAKMAGMAMNGQADCGGCSTGTDKTGMKHLACAQACLPLLAAVLPAELSVAPAEVPAPFARAESPEWDWSPTLNPSPPRS
jgi:hypothetical protein